MVLVFNFSYTQNHSVSGDSIHLIIKEAESLQNAFKYEQSIKIAEKALTLAQFNDDSKNKGYIYKVIAHNYEINNDIDKAIENYKKALIYAKLSNTKHLESKLYNNIGCLEVKNENSITSGISNYNKAYNLANKINDTVLMISPLINLGDHYIMKKEYKMAYPYLNKAKKLIDTKASNLHKTKINCLLAQYFLNVRRYKNAEKYINKAIIFASEENITEELAKAYKTNSDLHFAQKDYKRAYIYLNNYYKNLVKSNNDKRLIELQKANVKYEVDQYKRDLEVAEGEAIERKFQVIRWKTTIVLGIILIVISLIFTISSYRNNAQKKKLNNDLLEKNSELIKAKETAEQVSVLKSQFVSTVSHELRTPLYGVIGLTSMLMQDHPEEKKKEYLRSLKFSGDYLLALINDVLQLSKIETNEVLLEKTPFDIRSLVESIVSSLRSKQKNNNNTTHINIDHNIPKTLNGDSIRLSQILINLIGNALKFTQNGDIWITITHLNKLNNKHLLKFAIKDNGIGIPIDKQETIFENFVQVKNTDQEHQGTGLGLSIVKKLIELHNSTIRINSVENKGTEFFFELYFDEAFPSSKIISKDNSIHDIGTATYHILIVDDNKINQVVTQSILKKNGYTFDIAIHGKEAIEKAKDNSYDLILMDINMPEMNGLEATKIIRTFNFTIPIIALTAVEEGEVRDQALEVGMNDVIIKPYDTQQFFQTIIKNISKAKKFIL